MKMPSEHAFIRIEKDMKTGNIPGVVLLCGREEYLTDHYKIALGYRFTDPATRQMDLAVFSGEEIRAENIENAKETMPLMSQRRVIVIDRMIDHQGRYPPHLERSSADQKSLFETFLRMPEGTLLIISAERPKTTGDGRKKSDGRKLERLKKLVHEAHGSVYDFDTLEQGQLRNFIIKRFKSAGKTCSRDAMHRIMFDTGYGARHSDYDLYLLENDLKKAIAYSGQKEMVTDEDLKDTLIISPENNVFHMLDAMSRGRTDQALYDLNNLLKEGESEFAILSNIVRQLELMLISRELMDENKGGSQIVQYLVKEEKVGKFRAQKVPQTASRFTTRQIKSKLSQAIAVEEHIKTGLMPSGLALEYFIARG